MNKKFAIALAAVAIVLIGSLLYWQNQKTDIAQTRVSNQKLNNREGTGGKIGSSDNIGASPTTPGTREPQRDPTNRAVKYIYIKEWGVRFKLTNGLEGRRINYRVNDSSIKNSILILDESFKESDCIASGLLRTDLPNYQPDDSDGKNTGTFTLIKEKYYERIDGKVLCSSDNRLNSPAVEVQNELYKSMGSLEEY